MTESQASGDSKGPSRIYMFKSAGKSKLRAFAGDSGGSRLPQQHGPWHAIGVIRPDKDPPHNFSRADIDEAIEEQGYQLWRIKEPAAAAE